MRLRDLIFGWMQLSDPVPVPAQVPKAFLADAVAQFPPLPEGVFETGHTDPVANKWQHAAILVDRTTSLSPADAPILHHRSRQMLAIAAKIEEPSGTASIDIEKVTLGEFFGYCNLISVVADFNKVEQTDTIVSLVSSVTLVGGEDWKGRVSFSVFGGVANRCSTVLLVAPVALHAVVQE